MIKLAIKKMMSQTETVDVQTRHYDKPAVEAKHKLYETPEFETKHVLNETYKEERKRTHNEAPEDETELALNETPTNKTHADYISDEYVDALNPDLITDQVSAIESQEQNQPARCKESEQILPRKLKKNGLIIVPQSLPKPNFNPLYNCVLCKKTWNTPTHNFFTNFRLLVGSHLITHFYTDFKIYHQDHFEDNQCLKCDKNKGLNGTQLKNKHLYHKHGILKEDIDKIINSVLNIDEGILGLGSEQSIDIKSEVHQIGVTENICDTANMPLELDIKIETEGLNIYSEIGDDEEEIIQQNLLQWQDLTDDDD